jgi:hypothetical protein
MEFSFQIQITFTYNIQIKFIFFLKLNKKNRLRKIKFLQLTKFNVLIT